MTPQESYEYAFGRFVACAQAPARRPDEPALPGMTPWSATKSSLRSEGLDEDIIEAAELQLLSHIDLRVTAEILMDRIALPHELAHGGVPTSQVVQALRVPLAAMASARYPAPAAGSAQAHERQFTIESLLDSALMHSGSGCIHPFDDAQLKVITDLCMAAWENMGLDSADLTEAITEHAVTREVDRDVERLSLDFD